MTKFLVNKLVGEIVKLQIKLFGLYSKVFVSENLFRSKVKMTKGRWKLFKKSKELFVCARAN